MASLTNIYTGIDDDDDEWINYKKYTAIFCSIFVFVVVVVVIAVLLNSCLYCWKFEEKIKLNLDPYLSKNVLLKSK